MAFEIERKFLVKSDAWRSEIFETKQIKQAYFCNTERASLRVRVSNQQAFLSTKTMTRDIRRHEFEYEIPLEDAEFMLQYMCRGSPLIKQRHLVQVDHHVWEIDEFAGDNQGLIVAEVELEHETQTFTKPSWLGEEVSNEIRYFNFSLINHPFTSW